MRRGFSVVVACTLLGGCAAAPVAPPVVSREGQVGVREVSAGVPQAERLTLAENEIFQAPLPLPGNALPVYPAALLGRSIASRAICVQVGISETGRVLSTAPGPGSAECPSLTAVEQPFYDAATAAASTWQFEPAFRCVFDRVPAPGEACGLTGTQEVPQAVSLVYRFVFEQVNGRGAVRLGD